MLLTFISSIYEYYPIDLNPIIEGIKVLYDNLKE